MHCNYKEMLESAGVEPTDNRMLVLEVLGNNTFPLSAADVFKTVARNRPINRVTVYRILELLQEKHLVERLSTGGRASYYGLAPNEHHAPHPHFFCTICGRMDCLSPESLQLDLQNLEKSFPGVINRIEVRVDGVCSNCLKSRGQ